MDIQSFINQQTQETKAVFDHIHNLISKYDDKIHAEVGSVMGQEEALVYNQEGAFKYGITKTKNHYSFHSMVMYSYPELRERLKNQTKGIKFQKGCLNFKEASQIKLEEFETFIKDSALSDFSVVIEHYKKKK